MVVDDRVCFSIKHVGVLLLLSECVLLAVRTKSETAVSDLQKSVTSSRSRRPVTESGNKAEVLRACYRYQEGNR